MTPNEKQLPLRKFPIQHVSVVAHEGYTARSEFPHPLVTLDYDADGKLLEVTVIGGDLRVHTETGDAISIAGIKGNPELDREKYLAEYEASKKT